MHEKETWDADGGNYGRQHSLQEICFLYDFYISVEVKDYEVTDDHLVQIQLYQDYRYWNKLFFESQPGKGWFVNLEMLLWNAHVTSTTNVSFSKVSSSILSSSRKQLKIFLEYFEYQVAGFNPITHGKNCSAWPGTYLTLSCIWKSQRVLYIYIWRRPGKFWVGQIYWFTTLLWPFSLNSTPGPIHWSTPSSLQTLCLSVLLSMTPSWMHPFPLPIVKSNMLCRFKSYVF